MAPIYFASPDIAALVAAFPPPLPTVLQPSLIRSRSGDNLLDSRKVVARFRVLLENAPSRIKLAGLPSRLGIESIEWLLPSCNELLYYSQDGQSLVPKPVADELVKEVSSRLQRAATYAKTLARELDVSQQSLDHLLASKSSLHDIREITDEGTASERCLYSHTLATHITDVVNEAAAGERLEAIGLAEAFPGVPHSLLKHVANNALAPRHLESGRFQVANDRIVFIPISSPKDEEDRQQAVRTAQIQSLVEILRKDGICHFAPQTDGDHGILEEVERQYSEQDGSSVTNLVYDDSGASTLVLSHKLDEAMAAIKLELPDETTKLWHARTGPISTVMLKDAVIDSLKSRSSESVALALLHKHLSSHRHEIDDVILSTNSGLMNDDDATSDHRVGGIAANPTDGLIGVPHTKNDAQ